MVWCGMAEWCGRVVWRECRRLVGGTSMRQLGHWGPGYQDKTGRHQGGRDCGSEGPGCWILRRDPARGVGLAWGAFTMTHARLAGGVWCCMLRGELHVDIHIGGVARGAWLLQVKSATSHSRARGAAVGPPNPPHPALWAALLCPLTVPSHLLCACPCLCWCCVLPCPALYLGPSSNTGHPPRTRRRSGEAARPEAKGCQARRRARRSLPAARPASPPRALPGAYTPLAHRERLTLSRKGTHQSNARQTATRK